MTLRNAKNTKITATIMASLIIGLLMMSPLTIVPKVSAQSTAAEQLKTQIEPQPTAIGCYHYTQVTGWKTIACISAEELKKQPADIPTEGGVSPGVQGSSTTSTKPTYGQVDVKFTKYGGETDSGYTTSNTWSIQTNTNTWIQSSNSHKIWVQFLEQNNPSGNQRNCIFQFDLTAYPLNPRYNCVPVPLQTLSSTFEGFVTGYVVSSSTLRSTYCNVGTGNCYSIVDTNVYDLGSHWTQVSGTILGIGSGSIATFGSQTQETTTVQASSETSASTFTSGDTNEKNNLNPTSASTSCSSGTCTTTHSASI